MFSLQLSFCIINYLWTNCPVQFGSLATMWLFKLKSIKSLVPWSHWLHFSILDSTDNRTCHRKFCWTLLVKKQVATLRGRIEYRLLFSYPVIINSCYVGVFPQLPNCSNENVNFTERGFSFWQVICNFCISYQHKNSDLPWLPWLFEVKFIF